MARDWEQFLAQHGNPPTRGTFLSEADSGTIDAAIAEAGMAAIGATMREIEAVSLDQLYDDPLPFYGRALARFRVGVAAAATAHPWSHRQRFALHLFMLVACQHGGDALFVPQLTDAIGEWLKAQAEIRLKAPDGVIFLVDQQAVCRLADNVQHTVRANTALTNPASLRNTRPYTWSEKNGGHFSDN